MAHVEGADKVQQKLLRYGTAVRAALRDAVHQSAIELTGVVKEKKLTGQVLKVKTGRLRRSINYKLDDTDPNTVSATVGTNVIYAGVHEFGFTGTVNVRAHLRKTKNGTVNVPAHQRNMRMPMRSYLRSALRDIKPKFIARVNAALVKAKAEFK